MTDEEEEGVDDSRWSSGGLDADDAEAARQAERRAVRRRCQCKGRVDTAVFITVGVVLTALLATAFVFAPWDSSDVQHYPALKSRQLTWHGAGYRRVSIDLAASSPFPNAGNLKVYRYAAGQPVARHTVDNTSVDVAAAVVGPGSFVAYPLYLLGASGHRSLLTASWSAASVRLLVFQGGAAFNAWQRDPDSSTPLHALPAAQSFNVSFAVPATATYWFVFANDSPSTSAAGSARWSQLLQTVYATADAVPCTPQLELACVYTIAWGKPLTLVVEMSPPANSWQLGSPVYLLRLRADSRPTFYWLMVSLLLLLLSVSVCLLCFRRERLARQQRTAGALTEASPLVVQQLS